MKIGALLKLHFISMGLVLSGCVATPPAAQSLVPVVELSKPLDNQILNIDSGHGATLEPGGRVAVSSWTAGPNSDEHVFCWEPSPDRPDAAFQRFEYCLEYLNGVRSTEEYRMLIKQTYASMSPSAIPHTP